MPPKPLDLFIVAEQFRAAGKLAALIPHLATTHPAFGFARDTPNMPAPAAACMAFSLELYLKCLIRMGRKSYGREHDLVKLFDLVGRRNRAKIRKFFRENSAEVVSYIERSYRESGRPTPKANFDFVLSASKDAFIVMRYLYEGMPSDEGWLAHDIMEGARQVILDKHPNWERARQISPLPEVIVRSTFPVR
jgi:HEPN domain-containing protein